jgi:hypothetical protein
MVHRADMARGTRDGRPTKPADEIASRIEGMRRFSIELTDEQLAKVDREADLDDRSRNAEIRVLLAEALAARAQK